jgi:cytochrome c oxidase cbb3-type subunit 4
MEIGLNELRTMVTVAAFLTFLGIVAWAYSRRRKADYERAARMAVDDEHPAGAGGRAK